MIFSLLVALALHIWSQSLVHLSGVVSGTTVRALVLGRFSQKNKNKIER